MIEGLRRQAEEAGEELDLLAFYDQVVEATGYIAALSAKDTVENRTRIENVQELKSSIQGYLEKCRRRPAWAASWTRYPCTPIWTAGIPTRRVRHHDDHSLLQGAGVPQCLPWWGWRRPSSRAPGHRRAGGDGGGAAAVLCRHHPGQAAALPDLCRPADALRPHQHQPALPVHLRDPGGVPGEVRAAVSTTRPGSTAAAGGTPPGAGATAWSTPPPGGEGGGYTRPGAGRSAHAGRCPMGRPRWALPGMGGGKVDLQKGRW